MLCRNPQRNEDRYLQFYECLIKGNFPTPVNSDRIKKIKIKAKQKMTVSLSTLCSTDTSIISNESRIDAFF